MALAPYNPSLQDIQSGLKKIKKPVQPASFQNPQLITKQQAYTPVGLKPLQPLIKSQPQPTQPAPVAPQIDKYQTDVLMQLGGNIAKGDDLQTIRSKFPEIQDLDDEVLKSLGANIAKGDDMPTIISKFPELQQIRAPEAPMQGGVRRGVAGFSSLEGTQLAPLEPVNQFIDKANVVGRFTQFIDDNVQKIPTISKESMAKALKGTPFEGMEVLPTMVANAPGSLLKTASATARGITNPFDTIIGLSKLVMTPEGRQAVTDRYGSIEGLKQTLTQDPVGLASDVLTLVQGGAGLAGRGAKVAGMTDTASKLGQISDIAGGAADLGLSTAIPKGLQKATQFGEQLGQKGILGTAGQTAIQGLVEPTQPLQTAKQMIPKISTPTKDYVAKKLIDSKIKITKTNKDAVRKSTGLTPSEFILENDIGAGSVDDMITNTQDFVDRSMATKLQALESVKTPQQITSRERLIGNSIISQAKNDISEVYGKPFDEITPDEIVPELQEQFNMIQNVDKLVKSDNASAIQLEALKSLYDSYNSHLKYDPTKKRILSSAEKIRLGLQSNLETAGKEVGVDIKRLNKNIAGGKALEKGLVQSMDRADNNNIFGLSDTQTALLSSVLGGSPVDVALTLGGKSILEDIGVRTSIAKSLYTKKQNAQGLVSKDSIMGSSPTAGSNISRQFGSSNTTMNNNKPNDLKGLPAPKATVIAPGGLPQTKQPIAPIARKRQVLETGKANVKQPTTQAIPTKTKAPLAQSTKTAPKLPVAKKTPLKQASESVNVDKESIKLQKEQIRQKQIVTDFSEKYGIDQEKLQKVATNIKRNNPGLTFDDAVAMGKDVIEGRKFNPITKGKTTPTRLPALGTDTQKVSPKKKTPLIKATPLSKVDDALPVGEKMGDLPQKAKSLESADLTKSIEKAKAEGKTFEEFVKKVKGRFEQSEGLEDTFRKRISTLKANITKDEKLLRGEGRNKNIRSTTFTNGSEKVLADRIEQSKRSIKALEDSLVYKEIPTSQLRTERDKLDNTTTPAVGKPLPKVDDGLLVEASKTELPKKLVGIEEVPYRVVDNGGGKFTLYPNVGKKFSDDYVKNLTKAYEDIGYSVNWTSNGNKIMVYHRDVAENVVYPPKAKTKDEILYDKNESDLKEKELQRIEKYNKTIDGSNYSNIIDEVFGKDFTNEYNKSKLIEFLEGKENDFIGQYGPRWVDGLKKLGITKQEMNLPKKDVSNLIKKKLRTFLEQANRK